jgi:hypothetical protein
VLRVGVLVWWLCAGFGVSSWEEFRLGRCCFAATTAGRVAHAARLRATASLWLVGRLEKA